VTTATWDPNEPSLRASTIRGLVASSVLVVLLCAGLAGCSDSQNGELSADPATSRQEQPVRAVDHLAPTQEGQLVTYVADFIDGHSERRHALRLDDGSEVPLLLDTENVTEGAGTGDRIRVHGQAESGGFHVQSLELVADEPADAEAPVTYASPPSPDTYALVLVNINGADAGVNVTQAQGQKAMFSTTPTDKSFASFYFESSYGQYSVTGDVIGPYTYAMTTCDTTGMYQAIEPQITGNYNHLIYYFNSTPLCTFGGLGEEGSVVKPAKRTWMNGSLSCVVLMQEPGHNLGLMHGNTIACGTESFSTTPATSCTITEYGNTMTPMGSGCHQLNGYEKWYEQWLSGCNGVRVTSSGTFNLVPLGDSCPGAVQVLQIPMPATLTVNDPQAMTTNVNLKDYYVELRAAAGVFDQYNTRASGKGIPYTGPTVTVYVSDDVHNGQASRTASGNSVWTELLNMNPTSTTFAGLTTAGQTFSDPAGGATITLESISATSAVINVEVPNGTGGPTCIDGTTLSGTGGTCDGGVAVIPPFDAGEVELDAGGARGDAGSKDAGGATGKTDSGETRGSDASVSTGSEGGGTSGSSNEGGGSAVAEEDGGSAGADASRSMALENPAGTGDKSSGCACESVGASPAAPSGAWASLGVLGLMALRTKRRRRTG
jgi:MYXO-CTERM domain-containing protein